VRSHSNLNDRIKRTATRWWTKRPGNPAECMEGLARPVRIAQMRSRFRPRRLVFTPGVDKHDVFTVQQL
jgi:hypothetical protein